MGLVALLWLGFALRVYQLGGMSAEGDEAFSALAAGRGLVAIFTQTATQEPHPPLYFSLLSGWMRFAGWPEFSIRFLSLIFGVLLIPIVYRLGSRLFSTPAGLLAALVVATSPFQVWYAQTARMYTMLALFGAWSVWRFCRLRPASSRRRWAAFVAVTLLAVYSHYYGIFVVLFENLAWLVLPRRRPAPGATAWVTSQALVAAGYLPWLLYARRIALNYYPVSAETDYGAVLWQTLLRFGLGSTIEPRPALWLAPVFLALLALGVVAGFRHRPRSTTLALGYLLAPFVLGLAVSLLYRPLLATRYLIVASPAYALLVGLGLERVLRLSRPAGSLALLAVLGASLYSWHNIHAIEEYGKGHYRELAAHLAAHARAGDAVVLDGLEQADIFSYYQRLYPRRLERFVFPEQQPIDATAAGRSLEAIAATHAAIWFSDAGAANYDPDQLVERWLTGHAYRAFQWKTGYNRLVYYGTADPQPPPGEPPKVEFPGGLGLAVLGPPREARAGEVVPLRLRWRLPRELAPRLRVSLRLRDQDGRPEYSRDYQPGFGLLAVDGQGYLDDHRGLALPDAAPQGVYSLRLVAYDAESGRPFAPFRPGASGEEVELGEVRLLRPALLPPLRDVSPGHPLSLDVAPGLRLIGVDTDKPRYMAGERARLRFYWQSTGRIAVDSVRVALAGGPDGSAAAVALGPPAYPAPTWEVGEMMSRDTAVRLPAGLKTGSYPLEVAAVEGRARQVLRLTIEARDQSPPPASERAVGVRVGRDFELVGYSLAPAGPVRPGAPLEVSLTWRAINESDKSYTVYVHLLRPDGSLAAQNDSIPAQGTRPTSDWAPGDLVVDIHRLALPADLTPGRYTLAAGMYTPADGKRLEIPGSPSGSLNLGTVEVGG